MDLKVSLFIVQIVLQIFCAIYAYKCFSHALANGNKNFWNCLTLAFSLMVLRRCTAFASKSIIVNELLDSIDKLWLPLAISILLFLGMRHTYCYMLKMENISRENKRMLEELHRRASDVKSVMG